MKNVFIITLGCKINQYESACILDTFLKDGYSSADTIETADIVIINTCTVTNRTDYKSRNIIQKAQNIKRENPDVKVVLTGCYTQRNKDLLDNNFYIDLVVDNNDKYHILRYLTNQDNNHFKPVEDFSCYTEMKTDKLTEKSRAFLKIQDGCDFYCSYCAVPFARGKPRSSDINEILLQAKQFIKAGYEEIVLGGINLGLFNNDGYDLSDLLYKLNELKELKRIRLSSLEPQLFTDKLLKAIKDLDKICPHFHIPLQTGSDELLALHDRRYSIKDFLVINKTLHDIKYYPAIGYDIIVGLPDETDLLFEETFNLLKNLDFAYLHVFPYSKRKGTKAAEMKNQIHGSIAKIRSNRLIELSVDKKNLYIQSLIENKIILSSTIENNTPFIPDHINANRRGNPCGYQIPPNINNLSYGTTDRYVKAYFQNTIPEKKNIKLNPLFVYEDGVFCEEIK